MFVAGIEPRPSWSLTEWWQSTDQYDQYTTTTARFEKELPLFYLDVNSSLQTIGFFGLLQIKD